MSEPRTIIWWLIAALAGAAAQADEEPVMQKPTCTPGADFYPRDAKERHEEGVVKVRFCVGEDGEVTTAIVQGSGHPALDASAMCNVMDSIQRNARPDRRSKPTCRTVSIHYKLKPK